jgi:hypothetical protein
VQPSSVPPAPSSSPRTVESPQAVHTLQGQPVVAFDPVAIDPSLPAGVPVPAPMHLPPPPEWASVLERAAHTAAQSPAANAPPPLAPQGGIVPSQPPPFASAEPPEQTILPRGLLKPWSVLLAPDRPKWFLPAVAGGGFLVGVGLIGLLIGALRGGDSSAASPSAKASASAHGRLATSSAPTSTSTTSQTAATATAVTPAPAVAAPAAASTAACTVAGDPHTIASSATISAGVEAASLDGDLALGFATAPKDALAVRLDPSSFAAKTSARAHSADLLRRVTPFLNTRGGFDLLPDADRKLDRLAGRRAVMGDAPFDVGATGGQIVAVPHGGAGGARLWTLDGDGAAPEQIRGVRVPGAGETTYAFAFRRGGAIWVGVAAGDKPSQLSAKGPLARLAGLGGVPLGSPSIAASGTTIMVVWADHDAAGAPYAIRYSLFDVTGAAVDAQTFALPPGGEGTQGMSPAVAGLAGDRFLMVWTEGPEGSHQVRMQTLAKDGRSLGDAVALSPSGLNAGQGQAAATAGGQGVAAFLQENGKTFQIVAVPLSCPL